MLTMEMTCKEHQVHISSSFLAFRSAISVFIPAFYFLSGGKEWQVPYSSGVIIAPILLILVFYVPESPRFCYERKKYSELRDIIKRIAKSNGVNMNHNYDIDKEVIIKEESAHNQSKNVSKLYYLKQPIILLNLAVIVTCFISASFDTYLIGFHLKYIKGNIFFLSVVSTTSD
jgi:hypothetical protein